MAAARPPSMQGLKLRLDDSEAYMPSKSCRYSHLNDGILVKVIINKIPLAHHELSLPFLIAYAWNHDPDNYESFKIKSNQMFVLAS